MTSTKRRAGSDPRMKQPSKRIRSFGEVRELLGAKSLEELSLELSVIGPFPASTAPLEAQSRIKELVEQAFNEPSA